VVLLAGPISTLGCAKGTEIPATEIVYLQPQSPSAPDAGGAVDGDASTAFASEPLLDEALDAPEAP
jgi:hypothetical protein